MVIEGFRTALAPTICSGRVTGIPSTTTASGMKVTGPVPRPIRIGRGLATTANPPLPAIGTAIASRLPTIIVGITIPAPTATTTTTNKFHFGWVALEVPIEIVKEKRKLMNRFIAPGLVFLACVVLTPAVKADDASRKTAVTFSAPVEIPGVHLTGWAVLPAGTYIFKIVDSRTDRHVVQIFSKDEKTLYATILAIPNYRLKPADKTVMTFRERPAGEPEALRAWFSPGWNWGDEFVYPKAKALVLAKATRTPVLFTEAEIPAEVDGPALLPDAPLVQQLKQVPVMAFRPTGEAVQMAEVVTAPPASVEAAPAPVASLEVLPSTASKLPLIGLLGLLAISAALAVPRAQAAIPRASGVCRRAGLEHWIPGAKSHDPGKVLVGQTLICGAG